MKKVLWLAAVSMTLATAAAPAAEAQAVWFNGGGVSIGGGPATFRGGSDEPIVSLVRPEDDTVAATALGLYLGLGTRRWSLTLPELHYFPVSIATENVKGSITLGSTTVPFEPTYRSANSFAVMVGGQIGLVPNGRVWVRGGVGVGWMSSRIEAEDPEIGIDLSTADGLALSSAAGVSVWRKTLPETTVSLDVEVHYLKMRSDEVRISAPSIRVGLSVLPLSMP
jgi:hypothetical protein